MALDGQVRQEGVDLALRHSRRMPQAVEAHETTHPHHVSPFGPLAVMARSQRVAKLFQELRCRTHELRLTPFADGNPGRSLYETRSIAPLTGPVHSWKRTRG